MRNEPNFPSAAQGRAGRILRNEANSRRRRAGRGPKGMGRGTNCAKRSQTWEDWGMWAKAVIVCGAAWPESGTCKTKPISPGPAAGSAGGQACTRDRRRGQTCETKPICLWAIWRVSAVWKKSYDKFDPRTTPAKQSQFPAMPGGTRPEGWGPPGCRTNKANFHASGPREGFGACPGGSSATLGRRRPAPPP